MATFNGSRYIAASIASILSQTLRDFELIIVDDCSTDNTLDVIAAMSDPRIRVLRNERNSGVVASRNRCFAAARGRYVAMLDHDDLSRPLRLAQQARYLDLNPGVVLVGTAAHTLSHGVLAPMRHPAETTPVLVRWLLHIDNPLICSSVMMRADAVRALGTFMREDVTYADDYDLYHRLLPSGDIARIDHKLTIYRLHPANTFRAQEQRMSNNAVKALTPSYVRWFGVEAEGAASLVVNHFMGGRPVPDLSVVTTLRDILARLRHAFLDEYRPEEEDRRRIDAASDTLWRRMLQNSATRLGRQLHSREAAEACRFPSGAGLGASDIVSAALGQVPGRRHLGSTLRRLTVPRPVPSAVPGTLFGRTYDPVPVDPDGPPTLYVVIDTEAEFDWNKPFAKDLVNVSAIADLNRGQSVFERYGLRPIYVVDYPIATQERSVRPLRDLVDRDACFIGAHLHPWTNPPFSEEFTSRNSYPGNLPPDAESEKLEVLLGAIRASFGVEPQFYKAGRYGLGEATHRLLERHGLLVDLSVLPETDLRPVGGPDFTGMQPIPYRMRGGRHLTIPVTRKSIGLAPSLKRYSGRLHRLRAQAVLSRLRLSDTVTLTPEGISAEEQVRLVKAMLRQGHRLFVMHYHSPSLSPGHTPYVRTPADAEQFVQRIEQVCRFFFETLGGLPGYPPDLVHMAKGQAESGAVPGM